MVRVRIPAVAATVVAVTALALAGCDSGTGDGGPGGSPTRATGPVNLQGAPVEKASADPQPGGKQVTRDQFGAKWPLSVDRATLHCTGTRGAGAVTLYADGITYALNLQAQGTGYAQPGPIWVDDKDNAGMKLPMGPLVVEGMKLCR
jgi:hypothetical protein